MSQYDFGKLLILRDDSKHKKNDLKRLLSSKTVEELKDGRRSSWEHQHLHGLIANLFAYKNGTRRQDNYKIYAVDNDAVSTMFALSSDSFVSALTITEEKYQRLKILQAVMRNAEQITNYANLMLHIQDNYLKKELDKINYKYNFDEFSKDFERISSTYVDENISSLVVELNELLTSDW